MFHLVHKPLTTPSFLLVDVRCFLFFFFVFSFSRHPRLPFISVSPVFLSVSHSHSVPHVIGEWAHVVPIWHVWQLSPSVSPSLLLFSLLQFSWCVFANPLHASSFFMAVLKGLLPEGNGDEERHAGWFPLATYLRVMGLRKSDPREFIMRKTNPLYLRVETLLLLGCRGR